MEKSLRTILTGGCKVLSILGLLLIIGLSFNISLLAGIGGSGGEIFYEDGYTIHLFTSNGTFEPPPGIAEVEVLVVAGGGGGGGGIEGAGGGGGAGGLIHEEIFDINGPVDVIVGSGGSGGAPGERGEDGDNSSFDNLEAIGGGGGGSTLTNEVRGGDGGSGGGGGSDRATGGKTEPGTGTAEQGHDGGEGFRAGQSINRAGGGGGGAADPGQDAQNSNAGDGGAGLAITGFSDFGDGGYFAGGGGGGGETAGSGGDGGGGDGRADFCGDGSDAAMETGGGGGGAFCLGAIDEGFGGGDGGSGVVIVRYKTTPALTVEGDVCLELGAEGSAVDSSSKISWIGGVNNKITVEIEDGQVPDNLELTVDAARGNKVILTALAQDFITDISDERVIDHSLIYKLSIIGNAVPEAGETFLTVKFTIIEE